MKRRIRGRFTLFGVVFLLVGVFLFLTADLDATSVFHVWLMPAALCAVTGLLLFGLGARTSLIMHPPTTADRLEMMNDAVD